tara:strand:- start:1784 stop:2020 length:237 start_codon:yes stop_codon:yes gene_type:complete
MPAVVLVHPENEFREQRKVNAVHYRKYYGEYSLPSQRTEPVARLFWAVSDWYAAWQAHDINESLRQYAEAQERAKNRR